MPWSVTTDGRPSLPRNLCGDRDKSLRLHVDHIGGDRASHIFESSRDHSCPKRCRSANAASGVAVLERALRNAASGIAAAQTSPRDHIIGKLPQGRGNHGRTTSAPTRQPARLTASAEFGDERAGPVSRPIWKPRRKHHNGFHRITMMAARHRPASRGVGPRIADTQTNLLRAFAVLPHQK